MSQSIFVRIETRTDSAKGLKMAPKLIPLKLLSDGGQTISFMAKGRAKASSVSLYQSIIRDGLLNPLVVTQQGSKFIVIDGKKRLAVMRAMMKSRRLAKAIAKVPCVVQESSSLRPIEARRPLLLSGPELAHKVISAAKTATSLVSIGQRYECDVSVVKDCLALRNLHPELLLHFNNDAISLEQASALATVENKKAQLDLLHQLGPFVSNIDIIAAIRAGATVVELSEDNFLFLPSRRQNPRKQQTLFEFDNRRPVTASRKPRLVA
jgi:hypothetical protein